MTMTQKIHGFKQGVGRYRYIHIHKLNKLSSLPPEKASSHGRLVALLPARQLVVSLLLIHSWYIHTSVLYELSRP